MPRPRDGRLALLVSALVIFAGSPVRSAGIEVAAVPPDGIGNSITTLGDLFQDGADDFAAGAPFEAHATGNGLVRLYNGTPGGTHVPLTSLRSNQANCEFGMSVSTAGDVNGDGFPDLLVGAPAYDVSGHVDCGRAYLYLGTAFGYNAAPSWQFDTQEDGAHLGRRVAWAGDVNGDGYDDWLIGAHGHSNGEAQEGAVYLFWGGPGLLATTPAWTRESNRAGSLFGYALSTAGDMNADGYADIVVGAAQWSSGFTNEGAVQLFMGGPQGPSQVARTFLGGQAYAYLGLSLAVAGDVNGDGYSDFIAGAPYFVTSFANQGVALIHFGGPVPATYSALGIPGPIPNGLFASSVATAGDTNGDGYADVLVGATGIPQSNGQGAASLYLGHYEGVSQSPTTILDNRSPDHVTGICVATIGDGNGDGRSDWAAGVTSSNGLGPGELLFSNGRVGHSQESLQIAGTGQVANRYWGLVAAAPDVDGDGFDDLVVGSYLGGSGQSSRGVLTWFRGGTRAFPQAQGSFFVGAAPDWTYEGGVEDYLGTSLVNAGDVDGDGYGDFAAGASNSSNGQVGEGKELLFYGSPAGPAARPAWLVEGNRAAIGFGYASAGGGDFNGDGYDDLAVGAPFDSVALAAEGSVSVFLGSPLGLAHVPMVKLRGGASGVQFGSACVVVGDVNRDGFDDLAVGAPLDPTGGFVALYLGSPTGLHSPASQTLRVNVKDIGFGKHVARIGDVNGDGYSDLCVGAPYFTNGEASEGKIFVYHGSPAGLVDPAAVDLEGGAVNQRLGFASVGSAGDYNGDGYGDLMLGIPNDGGNGAYSGRVRIFTGGPGGLSLSPIADLTYPAPAPEIQFGYACGGDADFNGDGINDLYMTAPGLTSAYQKEGGVFVVTENVVLQGGMDRRLAAWRSDGSASIATGLRSNSTTGFNLRGNARSPAGRTRMKLEWEVKPVNSPFNGNGRARTAWQPTGGVAPSTGSSTVFNAAVTGLNPATGYRWRARYRSASPYFPSTPWFGDVARSRTERHLVTAGGQPPVAVEPRSGGALALLGASPNPFVESALLAFSLPAAGEATLAIHDVRGRLIKTLFEGRAPAGRIQVAWNGRAASGATVPAGAYFVRLRFGQEEKLAKIVRLD